jgi:hypothetical protein
MNTKALFAPLFASVLVLGLAGVAQADPVYYDLGAGGGVDGHTNRDGIVDPDQRTETFNELSVFANTTTTQFDTDGSGTLTSGDRFSDQGHLNVTGLVPGSAGDSEALNALNGYQMTAEWSGLTGVSSAPVAGSIPGTVVSGITYDAVGNTTFNFYVDDSNNGRTNFNYGATIAETDDVDATFNDGVLVLSVLIIGGQGTNTFNAAGQFLNGASVLIGQVTFALDDFWFLADGDRDFNELVGSLVKIAVAIDQNTNNASNTAGPCGDNNPATPCNPGDVLFVVDSDHDGSISFNLIPEPASLLMFGIGFLALGGISLVSRRGRTQA